MLLHNISAQEFYRLRARWKLLLIIGIFTLLCGLSDLSGIISDSSDLNFLYQNTANSYLVYERYLPLSIIATSIVTEYHLNDSFFSQHRSTLYWQTVVQNLMIIIGIWLIWVLTTGCILFGKAQLIATKPTILIDLGLAAIFILFVQVTFSAGTLLFYFLIHRKLIAVLIALFSNVLLFEQAVRTKNVLLYAFAQPTDVTTRLLQLINLIGLILLIRLVTYHLVQWREF
ncbi:hypothetical protein [Lactiplantibacillus xiangfangensis]|uniref:Uncharacterized protein n=1 Tax=Lactiplantibacillus xiangfangensis TaxID=942150 RepID=A0A0R2MFL9_9LACO|nr:hypothetical protein [Lactiplantibacillus xiangfangensis]KRO10928.1 hypothetical protein IV64_GL002621 [Lactiplantibacillus xiangfangensis]